MSRGTARAVVLFRVAAGPRTGFGHLVRALALARALGVAPRVSLRGGRGVQASARRLGARLVEGTSARAVLGDVAPSLLVVDDRVAGQTVEWRRAARAAGVPIASVHDLGLGLGDADLVIDASLRQLTPVRGAALLGPAYAILRAGLRRPALPRGTRRRSGRLRVLIALGGGPRATVAGKLASLAAARHPDDVVIQVAGGFLDDRSGRRSTRIQAVPPSKFDRAFARADLVVTAGGVTLCEACSLGIPSVAVAVVPSQRPTIEAVASRGAALDGGLLSGRPSREACGRVVEALTCLVEDAALRQRLARAGRRLVDGRGAARVAAKLHQLMARADGRRAR